MSLNCCKIYSQSIGIEITSLPGWEDTEDSSKSIVNGIVWGIDTSENTIAVYVNIDTWWEKWQFYGFKDDLSWSYNIHSSNQTIYCVAAFLLPRNYTKPEIKNQPSLPDSLFQYPHDIKCIKPGTRKIDFSGITWTVKKYTNNPHGPGPNFYSDSTSDVWVDGNGKLHLKIVNRNGKWYCTEVNADTSFGYGTYVFYLKTKASGIDPNAVAGFFTYDLCPNEKNYHDYGKNYPIGERNVWREIDIEVSKWGNPDAKNAQYVVQPWDVNGNIYRFNIDSNTITTHCFTWTKDSITFTSFYGDEEPSPMNQICSWSYSGRYIPHPENEVPMINFWLFDGISPSNNIQQEIIIKKFKYESLYEK